MLNGTVGMNSGVFLVAAANAPELVEMKCGQIRLDLILFCAVLAEK